MVITSRKEKDLEQAVKELRAKGLNVSHIAADCANTEEIKSLADRTLKELGSVDILVNNAGAAWGSPAEDHPLDAWDKVSSYSC